MDHSQLPSQNRKKEKIYDDLPNLLVHSNIKKKKISTIFKRFNTSSKKKKIKNTPPLAQWDGWRRVLKNTTALIF